MKLTFPEGTWRQLTYPQKTLLLSISRRRLPVTLGGMQAVTASALTRYGLLERTGYALNGLNQTFIVRDSGREVARFGRTALEGRSDR